MTPGHGHVRLCLDALSVDCALHQHGPVGPEDLDADVVGGSGRGRADGETASGRQLRRKPVLVARAQRQLVLPDLGVRRVVAIVVPQARLERVGEADSAPQAAAALELADPPGPAVRVRHARLMADALIAELHAGAARVVQADRSTHAPHADVAVPAGRVGDAAGIAGGQQDLRRIGGVGSDHHVVEAYAELDARERRIEAGTARLLARRIVAARAYGERPATRDPQRDLRRLCQLEARQVLSGPSVSARDHEAWNRKGLGEGDLLVRLERDCVAAGERLGSVRGEHVHLEPDRTGVVVERRPEPHQVSPGGGHVHRGRHGLSEDLAVGDNATAAAPKPIVFKNSLRASGLVITVISPKIQHRNSNRSRRGVYTVVREPIGERACPPGRG